MSVENLYPRLGHEQLAEEKEIKVRIPMQQHIQLHTLKVLQGQTISDTVKVALEAYFKGHPRFGFGEAAPAAWSPEAALEQASTPP